MGRLWTEADSGVPAYIDHNVDVASSLGLVGGEADTWTNLGSLGGVATAIGAGNRFEYVADAGDGLPALRSGGADQMLSDSRIILVPGARILAIVRANNAGAGIHRYLAQGQNGFPENVTGLIARVNEGIYEVTTEASNPAIRTTTVYRPTGGIGWLLIESSDLGFILNNGINYRISGHLGGEYWNGDIARIVMLHPDTSADDAARWRGRLAWSRNLQSGLPADDQFRNSPPMIGGGASFEAGAGVFDISGRRADILIGHRLPAEGGSLALAGMASSIRADRLLPAKPGSLMLGGQAVLLRQERRLAAAPGALAGVGGSANLMHGHFLSARSGAFEVSPSAAALLVARKLAADAGAFEISASAISTVQPGRLVLAAGVGKFEATGRPAALQLRRRIVAGPAGFILTGLPATIAKADRVSLVGLPGSFDLAGHAAVLRQGRRLTASAGTIVVRGQGVVLRAALRLSAAGAVITLTPRSATLTIGEALPPIVIPLGHRFVIPVRQRSFVLPRRQRSYLIRKGTSMATITKYAAEERQYQADWAADLNGQALVGDIEATAGDPALLVDRVTYNGSVMKFWLAGGSPNAVTTLQFRANTNGGERLEWDVIVTCM